MSPWLPNPERAWRPAAAPPTRDEIEARVGARVRTIEVLSGGLANANVRVDAGPVVRLYRRDVGALAKEACLLELPWASFRVPRVLGRGDDFLLLEYVPHGDLPAGAEQGRATGRALAEIHARRYDEAGLLGPELGVERPFGDVFEAFRRHARAELRRAAGAPPGLAERVLDHLDGREGALRAAAGAPALLHGDFKASNLRLAEGGQLLVLDWEFAYAGPPLLDLGQLVRWGAPPAFTEAFAAAYWGERCPPEDWRELADTFDLFNLVGLLAGARDDATRTRDVLARVEATLARGPGAAPSTSGAVRPLR